MTAVDVPIGHKIIMRRYFYDVIYKNAIAINICHPISGLFLTIVK